jgi:hypothetical protein
LGIDTFLKFKTKKNTPIGVFFFKILFN